MNKCRHLIAVAGALLLLASATSRAQDTNVITRTARYWFTHVYSNDTTCATLERVVAANSNRLNLGFITLPTQLHTGGTEVSSLDATVEALGFYYRGISRTGDNYPGSKLCTARKQMVPELVAAIANNVLLGTDPANATYRIGANPTNFPPDLIQQATQAAAGYDVLQIRYWTLLLRKFNGSGVAKALATSPFECNQNSPRELRLAAYDPTLWYTCPSINDTCVTSEVVVFPPPPNWYTPAQYNTTIDMRRYKTDGAYFVIAPQLANPGRSFTVDTRRSNFPVSLEVLSGTCALTVGSNGVVTADSSELSEVGTTDVSNFAGRPKLRFTTDGSSTYFIKVSGAAGRASITVTSP